MSLLSCWDSSFIDDKKLKLELLFSYKPKFGYKESGKIKHYDKFFPEFGVFLTKDSGSSFVNIDIIVFKSFLGIRESNEKVVNLILDSPELCVAFGEDLKSHMERLNTERLTQKNSVGLCERIMCLDVKSRFPVSSIDGELESRKNNKERVCSMMVQENEGIKRLYYYADCEHNLKKFKEKKVSEIIDSFKDKGGDSHKKKLGGICSRIVSGNYNISNTSIGVGSSVIALGGMIGLMSGGYFVVGLVFFAGVLGAPRLAISLRKPLFSHSFSESLGVCLNDNNNSENSENSENSDNSDNLV